MCTVSGGGNILFRLYSISIMEVNVKMKENRGNSSYTLPIRSPCNMGWFMSRVFETMSEEYQECTMRLTLFK